MKLAKEYVSDLQKYDDSIVWDEDTWERAVWDAWFIKEDRMVQGFVITEEISFRVYKKLLYIEEFYVVPEERMRGVGLAAAKKLSEMWNGDVFLYILDRNSGAKWFWTMVEQKLGWKRIERGEIKEERGCELRVYQTKQEVVFFE